MTRLRKSAYEKTKQMLQRLSLEEQQRLRDTVSNRPRTSHVCSTLIQFFILFFPSDPTPQENRQAGLWDRGGAATSNFRKASQIQREEKGSKGGGEGQC